MFSDRMGKPIDSIPLETMFAFQWHSWPGNIRELQNLVERAVILSRDGVLPNSLFQRRTGPINVSMHRTQACQLSMTSEDSDRALIVETLEQVGWVVGGLRGAAGKLGLKRTTLLAKMRRLGISRPIHQEETDLLALAPADIRREDARL
jgi:formate hydrogenlyase transcriptional activator